MKVPAKPDIVDREKEETPPIPDPFRQYWLQIRSNRILARDEEIAAFISYREFGDEEARDLLVASCQRFVVKLAHKYESRAGTLHFSDLVQHGNIALIDIIASKFSLEKRCRLSTYAKKGIEWAVLAAIRDYGRERRLTPKAFEQIEQISKVITSLIARLRDRPSLDQVVAETQKRHKISRDRIIEIFLLSNSPVLSLDYGYDPDDDGEQLPLIDIVVDPEGSAYDKARNREFWATVWSALGPLPERERKITFLHYVVSAYTGGRPKTEKIMALLGLPQNVTVYRAYQRRGLKALRSALLPFVDP